MRATTEDVEKGSNSTWKMLLAGFVLGVLVSLLMLVVLAFKYGPRGENTEVDLYSGHTITHRSFLWKRSHIPGPKPSHVRWAIQHQDPVRSWYRPCSSMSRGGWFEPLIAVDFATREYVVHIHSLPIPKEEKIALLHQYHEELDALRLKEQELRRACDFMERFYKDWEQKLKNIGPQDTR